MKKKEKRKSKDNLLRNPIIGNYLLLDHLTDGGMAKIYRAKFFDKKNIDRIVAIKVVRKKYSRDRAFRKMFMSEVKVAYGLSHPNIAQTYEYGELDKNLYIAMEYIDGKNLSQIIERLGEKKMRFPVDICLYIVSQVCQGLHYAHTYTDKLKAKETSIIHRDISPQNIMIRYDGAVKIIDFGIAKTEINVEKTGSNIIKGKVPYLAPEYLEGKALDGRYDEFALGITMWEMLCNKRLFPGDNHLTIIKQIQECRIPPPSNINPEVPPEVDEVVLKMLSKNREDRFKNIAELNRTLIKILYSLHPDFNPSDISNFSLRLFKSDIEREGRLLREFGKIDLRYYPNDRGGSGPAATGERKKVAMELRDKLDSNRQFEDIEQDDHTPDGALELEVDYAPISSFKSASSSQVRRIRRTTKQIRHSGPKRLEPEEGPESKDEDHDRNNSTKWIFLGLILIVVSYLIVRMV